MPNPRDEIRALVLTNPITALERLRHPGESGLTRMGEANVLDEVVGTFSDPAAARRVLDANLTRERQVELIATRGDLPSSAALVVDQNVVFEALLRELTEEIGEYRSALEDAIEDDIPVEPTRVESFVIRAWALKYRDRDDWAELLLRSVGGLTVREHLVIAIWNDAGCPQVFDEPPVSHGEEDERHDDEEDDGAPHARLTDDQFDAVGLDPEEARETLALLIAQGRATQLSRDEVDDAKLGIAERRRERETAPLSSDAARGGAEEMKNELDI